MGKKLVLFTAFLFIGLALFSQRISGVVLGKSGKPLPFATIKFGNTQNGMVADLDGRFEFKASGFTFIIVSYLNYQSAYIEIGAKRDSLTIVLQPKTTSLADVVIKSISGNKLRRILNKAIEQKANNNPEKYDWYRCNIYYKMTSDLLIADSMKSKDSGFIVMKELMQNQHLFVNESYSRRTWKSPAQLQDDILATRISGLKKSFFASLVTDILPFHAYNDFINLNGKDYKSPLSKGLYQHFTFNLQDEIRQDADTIWVITFKPKKESTELSGTLYIHSDGYALGHLVATATDTILQREIKIEQQYKKQAGRWFPEKLNYLLTLHPGSGSLPIYMKGTSLIDSVSFTPDKSFRFDKAHTTRMMPAATDQKDSTWQQLRPEKLQPKENRTYAFLDSLGEKHHFDNFIQYGYKLVDGKFPAGKYLDMDLSRFAVYNKYEGYRLGVGLQTSENVFKSFSVGGWFGYGIRDKAWKYGGFGEFQLDQFKEFSVGISYTKDLSDPGRLQINKEIDNNFLRAFLLNRVDNKSTISATVKKKLGYLSLELTASQQKIVPQYAYGLQHDGKSFTQFTVKEISVGIRYAFGEITTPIFGKYFSGGSKYPVAYAKLIAGKMEETGTHYLQTIAAIRWQKNINRFGLEKWLLIGAASFSNQSLPLSKLFAGNGFSNSDNSLFVFGGMQTMTPYAYYSDRFINFYWLHEFPFRFYKAKLTRNWSSAPGLSVGYNVLWGTMKERNSHLLTDFKVPDKEYHETGLLINGLARFNFLGTGYGSIIAGYFYHWQPTFSTKQNGRFVFGLGIDL